MLTPLPYDASRRPVDLLASKDLAPSDTRDSMRKLAQVQNFRRELKSPREAFRLKASYSSSESAEDGCYSGASGIARHGWLYRTAGLPTMEEWE
jgi:hypothetical protein